jgi:hypothetical protein
MIVHRLIFSVSNEILTWYTQDIEKNVLLQGYLSTILGVINYL